MAGNSNGADKAWATRRKNGNKRQRAAKKAWKTIRARYGEDAGTEMANKAWKTRRLNESKRSRAAKKAWKTRRKNAA